MGLRNWWIRRRANTQIERIVDAVRTGKALMADATALEASGVDEEIAGVVEVCDDHLHFKSNADLKTRADGWRIDKAGIEGVHDGNDPGEVVIAFRASERFHAIVVTPVMHADKWRSLGAL
ncbi:hypothetical protein [Streptomyces sp. SID7909]|uniref:hypothetical protein n=1 Tax=Streptomyces sp. SID7909 TaxID=2706092 RepID=UPI0013BC4D42|nr:hypothetical protein [Streptomyces sp. SID7909]NEC04489.1 hypothetical protein [Streptomyces sp. SID7909]